MRQPSQRFNPMTYRQLKEALDELTPEQLDMTVTLMDEDDLAFCVFNTCLFSELPEYRQEQQELEGNQPLLLSY